MKLLKKGCKVYVYPEPIDMRFSFNTLLAFVTDDYSLEIFLEGHVFVFFGRNRRRLKSLFYDGTGLVLMIKKIEKGRFMWIYDLEREEVSAKEFEQLMHGSDLRFGKLGEMP